MTKQSICQSVVLGLLLAWPAGSPADEPKPISPIGPGYRLTWHDEFDGDRGWLAGTPVGRRIVPRTA